MKGEKIDHRIADLKKCELQLQKSEEDVKSLEEKRTAILKTLWEDPPRMTDLTGEIIELRESPQK